MNLFQSTAVIPFEPKRKVLRLGSSHNQSALFSMRRENLVHHVSDWILNLVSQVIVKFSIVVHSIHARTEELCSRYGEFVTASEKP